LFKSFQDMQRKGAHGHKGVRSSPGVVLSPVKQRR
jgi:hypothetical protein